VLHCRAATYPAYVRKTANSHRAVSDAAADTLRYKKTSPPDP
jgi:hypothetical protein